MEMLSDLVAAFPFASATRTVKVRVPVAFGVPEMAPVVALRVRPLGGVPDAMDQASGALPPVACSACAYADATMPSPSAAVVTWGSSWTASGRLALAVWPEPSSTVTATVNEPAAAGVPDSTPLAGSSASPAGSAPDAAQV